MNRRSSLIEKSENFPRVVHHIKCFTLKRQMFMSLPVDGLLLIALIYRYTTGSEQSRLEIPSSHGQLQVTNIVDLVSG